MLVAILIIYFLFLDSRNFFEILEQHFVVNLIWEFLVIDFIYFFNRKLYFIQSQG